MNIPRRALAATAAGAAGLLAVVLGIAVSGTTASAASCQVAAAGDIAESGGQQAKTAAQIQALAVQNVLPLGDLTYEQGAPSEYTTYYDPTWGKFKSITRPAIGNHEYGSPEYSRPSADGYFGYFASVIPASSSGTQAYYAFDVCGWRLYSLNSSASTATSPTRAQMLAWFNSDVAAHPSQPKLAYWHKPFRSDGTGHGDDANQADLFAAAANAHVRLVLNGHDHVYERYAEMNASGVASAGGTREFIVGTGGAGLGAFDSSPNAASQVRRNSSHGVLLLTLRSNGYDYNFSDWDGSYTDAGSLNFPVVSSSPPPVTSTTPPVTSTTSTSTPPVTSTTPCPPASTVTVTAPATTVTATVTAPATTVTRTVTPTPTPFVATLTGTVTPPV